MVKQANIMDLSKLLDWSETFHSTTPYKDIPFERDTVQELLLRLIDGGGVFLNEHGFVAGTLVPLTFNQSHFIAAELAWYCPEGDGQELKKAFEDWAEDVGALGTQFSTLVNGYTQKLGELLIADNFKPLEVSYFKEF